MIFPLPKVKLDWLRYKVIIFSQGSAITQCRAIEQSQILLSQYLKNYPFERVPKDILHFAGTNNIFATCMKTIGGDFIFGSVILPGMT